MKKITEKCTNCGACLKRCPNEAISFQKKGIHEFAVIDDKKCTNCGLCSKICPSNCKSTENKPTIKVGRLKNSIDIKKSSSGGIFGELARKVLSEEGIVYGAAFTEDYKEVKHIRCETLADLDKILKSKYVRSQIENTYVEAEKDLKKKKTVLFSGTPCQIAGLKSFLKKDYENLYTVDIVCHGTPSPTIWKKYANFLEKRENSKITFADFRHFDEKSPNKNFYIEFENGNVLKESLYDTSYGRAFLVGLINGDGCGDCKFNNFHNKSDITLGDAWGYKNKKYPHKNSIIMINTEKGKELYRKIRSSVLEFTDFDFHEILKKCYPIIHSTFNHYNRERIDFNAKNIDEELWHWLDEKNGLKKDKKGVGILNFHYENYNYGANLVAYSLSETIRSIGYNPYIIDFDPFEELDPVTRYQTLSLYDFRQKYLNMTPRFRNKEDLEVLNNYLDMFITGSDQVWRKAITHKNLYAYFLDFAKNKNKISYGASFGKDLFEGTDVEKIHCTKLLSSFYNISVRENDANNILKNIFNTKGEVVLDPTLLLNKEQYEKLIDEEYEEDIDVAVYYIMDAENKILEDEDLKKLFPNKKIVNLKGEMVDKPYGTVLKYNSMSKWLDGFRKAKCIVTDSYHGLIFSIIFKKDVICIGKNSAALSRFNTLIQNLRGNLDKVIYSSLKEVKEIHKLNYEEIENILEEMRKKSIDFLKENLGRDKIKAELEFYEYVDSLAIKYSSMEELLNQTTEELNKIVNSRTWKMTQPVRDMKRIVKKIV